MKEDWEIAISGEILDVRDGTHDTPKYVKHSSHPLITSKNLKNNNIDFSNVKYISNKDFQEIGRRSAVEVNDVLFAMIGTIGNPVIIKEEPNFAIKNVALFKNPDKLINSHLLKYYLESNVFFDQLNKREFLKGTTQRFIPLGHLRNLKIPLPPLPIQRAIVAKIEELSSSLDSGIADLKKAQEQLKVYRQAVLKKAFEGNLTNSENQIETVPLEDEIQIVSGSTPKGINDLSTEGEFSFFKVGDMNSFGNEIEMKAARISFGRTEQRQLKIKIFPKGTVIFPKRGGAILTNKKRLLSEDSAFDLNLMGLVPNENYIAKFLFYFMESTDLGKICDGSAVPQINNKNIAPLDFPKCNKEVQMEIVKEIERLFTSCEQAELDVSHSLTKAGALRQSVLRKAFEGKLLSEEEIKKCKEEQDYEPAEALLQKIKAEKKKK